MQKESLSCVLRDGGLEHQPRSPLHVCWEGGVKRCGSIGMGVGGLRAQPTHCGQQVTPQTTGQQDKLKIQHVEKKIRVETTCYGE